MSDIDLVLSQTYPHVAMLPYMQCQHCNYEEPEETNNNNSDDNDEHPSSPTSFITTFSSSSIGSEDNGDALSTTTSSPHGWLCLDNRKRSKIRRRLRQLLKRSNWAIYYSLFNYSFFFGAYIQASHLLRLNGAYILSLWAFLLSTGIYWVEFTAWRSRRTFI